LLNGNGPLARQQNFIPFCHLKSRVHDNDKNGNIAEVLLCFQSLSSSKEMVLLDAQVTVREEESN